jgi:hypothetical protein
VKPKEGDAAITITTILNIQNIVIVGVPFAILARYLLIIIIIIISSSTMVQV